MRAIRCIILLLLITLSLHDCFVLPRNPSRYTHAAITSPTQDISRNVQFNIDLSYLRGFDDRVRRLGNQEAEFMSSFWDEVNKCFKIYPKVSSSRVSITSTCWAIDAIIANHEHWNSKARWEDSSTNLIPIGSAVKALKETTWVESFISFLFYIYTFRPEN